MTRIGRQLTLTTVQELECPSQHGNQGGSQLEAFAMGVMAHVAADFMADGGVKDYAGVKAAIYLRDHPLEVLGPACPNKGLTDWLKACLDHQADLTKLAGLLKRRGVDLGEREKAWLRVLAATPSRPSTASSATRHSRGFAASRWKRRRRAFSS